MKFNELDVVKTSKEFSEYGINKGETGVIILAFNAPDEAYEVEFDDGTGRPKAILTIMPQYLELANSYTSSKSNKKSSAIKSQSPQQFF